MSEGFNIDFSFFELSTVFLKSYRGTLDQMGGLKITKYSTMNKFKIPR